MKTRQYCVIENNDGVIGIHTYPYTEQGASEAAKLVNKLAKENDIDKDIVFDWSISRGEAITNLTNPDTSYDLILLLS
jgi:hypothetical protein